MSRNVDGISVYPVGWLWDFKRTRGRSIGLDHLSYRIKKRSWRAVRNHVRGGYLAEWDFPKLGGISCGWGLTKKAAKRRLGLLIVDAISDPHEWL